MLAPLYIGMGPPYVVDIVVAASADFDPVVAAAASAIAIVATKPDGSVVEWAAVVVVAASGALSVTVRHALALGDLDQRGEWSVWARFTLAGGAGELRSVVGRLPPVLTPNQSS
jgi:hypothetical protein